MCYKDIARLSDCVCELFVIVTWQRIQCHYCTVWQQYLAPLEVCQGDVPHWLWNEKKGGKMRNQTFCLRKIFSPFYSSQLDRSDVPECARLAKCKSEFINLPHGIFQKLLENVLKWCRNIREDSICVAINDKAWSYTICVFTDLPVKEKLTPLRTLPTITTKVFSHLAT